jgi:UDP-N-acetylglucosamine--N-acetylmuramyl-(pentapeptide) pyrophosphoryl-undecaprenol N-acetylglucosamine transferase
VVARTHRIVFAGGGTGGHLYPALAVANTLRRRDPGASISFIGARRGLERRLVPRAGYPLLLLGISGIKGRGLPARVAAALAAAWAVVRCLARMVVRRPDLVVGVGGYASGPAVLAGWLLGVRTMLIEQNHLPGATNRWLAPRAGAVCVPSETARERLGGTGIVTGNPVRREFAGIGDPPGAESLSLLVFGGSRGARSINRAASGALGGLARLESPPRIVHQTGEADEEPVRDAYRAYPEDRAEVVPFLDDMPRRMAEADLVICRAGATTVAELAAAGRPSLLVPFPHATDDHQRRNAEELERTGAAIVIDDGELDGELLARRVAELDADRERLRKMGHAARSVARPDAADRIADVAERLIAGLPADGGRDVS